IRETTVGDRIDEVGLRRQANDLAKAVVLHPYPEDVVVPAGVAPAEAAEGAHRRLRQGGGGRGEHAGGESERGGELGHGERASRSPRRIVKIKSRRPACPSRPRSVLDQIAADRPCSKP